MTETHYTIPGAPGLALLTDLHNRPFTRIVNSLRNHCPGLICIAGDVVSGQWYDASPLDYQGEVLHFFSTCTSIAPTFFSLGNHELYLLPSDLERIAATGVELLDNTWVERNGLRIGGLTSGYVTDYRAYREMTGEPYPPRKGMDGLSGITRAKEHRPDLSWMRDFEEGESYHLLLSHHPEYWPQLKDKKIDLMLSGHAHGGQWRFYDPVKRQWRGVFAPGQGMLPSLTSGVVDGRLVISRGLSNTERVPRFFNPTEVVYINTRSPAVAW